MRLNLGEGEYLIRLARKSIETYLESGERPKAPKEAPKILFEKRGVFVTLQRIVEDEKRLRGCIGFIIPQYSLLDATIRSAISAAVDDPRFPPVESSELKKLSIEVSVLTPAQLVRVDTPREYASKIRVGRDGLIAKLGWKTGVLLPQVPVEYGWDEEKFIKQTCIKAFLPQDAWNEDGFELYSFQSQIFEEKSPDGEVEERSIS
ncbi:MAG: TIGR00296 family protein [Candidatus Hodarchaeota archaeon]